MIKCCLEGITKPNVNNLSLTFQGTTSCSYCAHKREKYVILKQSCKIKPPKTCHHNEHLREVNCYNCKVNDLVPLEEDL